jgi:hypothetical protein
VSFDKGALRMWPWSTNTAQRVGQIDLTVGKVMATQKGHHQYVLSRENGRWLIQTELIMDEKRFERDTR